MDQNGVYTRVGRSTLFDTAATGRRRFPDHYTEAEQDCQLEKRDKVLERLKLEPFRLRAEKDFDDWVDKTSR